MQVCVIMYEGDVLSCICKCMQLTCQFDIMSETHFSCDIVGRELWLAIVSSLLCPEMDWNTRIAGKARLCVYFN